MVLRMRPSPTWSNIPVALIDDRFYNRCSKMWHRIDDSNSEFVLALSRRRNLSTENAGYCWCLYSSLYQLVGFPIPDETKNIVISAPRGGGAYCQMSMGTVCCFHDWEPGVIIMTLPRILPSLRHFICRNGLQIGNLIGAGLTQCIII